jgi:hypothetical protein
MGIERDERVCYKQERCNTRCFQLACAVPPVITKTSPHICQECWGRCSGTSRRQVSEPRGCQTSRCGAADVPVGGPILVAGTETGLLDLTAETCHQRH